MNRIGQLVPLLVFFLLGLSAFDNVAMTFYVRDHIHLSAAQLIEIGIWTSLPWSVKVAFGAVIDSFAPWGNNRKSYLILGALIQAAGLALFAAFVAGISPLGSEYTNLLVSGLLTTIGVVFGQTTANTLAVELVEPSDLGKMQVATRIAFSTGAIIAAILTGYLASHYTLLEISIWKLLLPLSLLIGSLILLKEERTTDGAAESITPQWRMLGLATLFVLFCIITKSQIAIFLAQMIVVNYLLWKISRSMSLLVAKTFLLSCLAIFLFRVSPDVGPGFSWWTTGAQSIGGLGFDPIYLGHLRMISTGVDIIALILLSKIMAKGEILKSLTWLTVIGTVVSIPALLVYYHYVGAPWVRTIFLADTAVAAPLGDLSMIPLGILIARAAPAEGRAMYMAVTASFMNMAILGGDLLTRGLNTVYTVTRTDFSQLGALLLWTTAIGLGLSVIGLTILRKVGSK